MSPTRIIIVDDHPLFRGALKQALANALEALEIVESGSLDELTDELTRNGAVVQGLSGLLYLRTQYPEVPVVIVSASEDPGTIRGAIGFGALGFVPKSQPADQIRVAIHKVLSGEIWVPPDVDLATAGDKEAAGLIARLSTLTPQQVRVLMMVGEGLLNKQIAFRLNVSEATIKAHVSAILQKLGVDSRTQAVIAMSKIGSGDWQRIAS